MLGIAPLVTSLTFVSPARAADDQDTVARLLVVLNTPGSGLPSADREEAALQLVNRNTPQTRAAVQELLKNAANTTSQIAVAKAVSLASDPDPALIPTLGHLLGPNRPLTESAANALANFRGTTSGFDQLRRFVDITNNPNASRIAAIHAIGALVDPEPANVQYLLDLSSQANQSQAIRDAATESLGDMTGVTTNGKDVLAWQRWWAGFRGKTADQFRAKLLETRTVQFNLLKQRYTQLTASARLQLEYDYTAIPAKDRDTIVFSYLNDRAPDIRYVGVELVFQDWQTHPPVAKVRARLFAMIGDSDDKVRFSTVDLMRTLNDPNALKPLIAQLLVEKDPRTKQLIAQALGNLADPAAVRPLLALLHDSQPDNVIAAAKAFTNLGDNLHQKDPVSAGQVSNQIRQVVAANENQPGTDDLRAACITALAALRDPASFDTFMDCFKRGGDTPEVRRAALVGLANLGNTNADATVKDQLDDSDRTIRLEAARALKTVGTPEQDQAIFQQMNSDPDPDVSKALWEALQNLYVKEPPAQLQTWANRFDKDPEKKLVTLQKLGEELKQGNDPQAVAFNEQAIAEAIMAMKPPPEKIADAIIHLQNALDYWRGPGKASGGSDERLETLIGQMLDDKLLAQQWADATTFAADQISFNPAYGRTVGYRIKEKIDELIADNKPAEAQKLIDAALVMKPPLDPKYVQQIQQSQNDLKQKP